VPVDVHSRGRKRPAGRRHRRGRRTEATPGQACSSANARSDRRARNRRAYIGSPKLLDYSATKGAIVSFTRSLALALADRDIRVNAVPPGPIWTPLIPASFDAKHVATFGSETPLGRPSSRTAARSSTAECRLGSREGVVGQGRHLRCSAARTDRDGAAFGLPGLERLLVLCASALSARVIKDVLGA
jgi:NAD(P)-dependent dehydrogenase (short-subunit alcohol dehydrogenase family)